MYILSVHMYMYMHLHLACFSHLFPPPQCHLACFRRPHVSGRLSHIIHPLEGMVMRLTLDETVLTEVKVSTNLTMEARTFDRYHATTITSKRHMYNVHVHVYVHIHVHVHV